MMSNLQHLAIFMFLVFLPMVISRECYQCYSVHSFEDCDAKRINVRCLSATQCVKASVYKISGTKDEGYVKACAATCLASDISVCNNPNYKCEVKCCSPDYCNGASGTVVSGLILIVTVSFMYLFEF